MISVCGASYDYGEIDFFSFDTRAGKQLVWISCSLGLGFILLMLEDKLYDMFAYIFYGAMMLLLLVTPFKAEDSKGSYSLIMFGPVSLQRSECAKFATALALAKFMNVYGFTMSKLKYSLPVTGMILLPMLLIILQRETGSALVYLAFFFMLYREGMPGSILFAGICAVVYFVVGIRFSQEMMADDCTSVGEFSVLLLITILSAMLVNSYCKKKPVVWYINGFGYGFYKRCSFLILVFLSMGCCFSTDCVCHWFFISYSFPCASVCVIIFILLCLLLALWVSFFLPTMYLKTCLNLINKYV